jgi:hypothetical protein
MQPQCCQCVELGKVGIRNLVADAPGRKQLSTPQHHTARPSTSPDVLVLPLLADETQITFCEQVFDAA